MQCANLCGHFRWQVFVYVNKVPLTRVDIAADGSNNGFNTILGRLVKGDHVYVSVGPGQTDSNDGFYWDFTIRRLDVTSPVGQILASAAVRNELFDFDDMDCEPAARGQLRYKGGVPQICREAGWRNVQTS